jgi:hypothetical protein
MWPTRKYVQNAQVCIRVYIVLWDSMTVAQQDWHVIWFAAKNTTSNWVCSSYLQCGPRISQVLCLYYDKMTSKNMTLKRRCRGEPQVEHLVRMRSVWETDATYLWDPSQSLHRTRTWHTTTGSRSTAGVDQKSLHLLMTSSVRKASFTIGLDVWTAWYSQ